jgi:small-conductance mechanosensitive channel
MRVSEYFDQRIGRHLFIKKLHKRYQEVDISIPFPIQDVYIKENVNSDEA